MSGIDGYVHVKKKKTYWRKSDTTINNFKIATVIVLIGNRSVMGNAYGTFHRTANDNTNVQNVAKKIVAIPINKKFSP
jgi:hypothetical protein